MAKCSYNPSYRSYKPSYNWIRGPTLYALRIQGSEIPRTVGLMSKNPHPGNLRTYNPILRDDKNTTHTGFMGLVYVPNMNSYDN